MGAGGLPPALPLFKAAHQLHGLFHAVCRVNRQAFKFPAWFFWGVGLGNDGDGKPQLGRLFQPLLPAWRISILAMGTVMPLRSVMW